MFVLYDVLMSEIIIIFSVGDVYVWFIVVLYLLLWIVVKACALNFGVVIVIAGVLFCVFGVDVSDVDFVWYLFGEIVVCWFFEFIECVCVMCVVVSDVGVRA